MPGSAHVFFGLLVGIILYHATGRKFTPYHVFLFAFNNILGPDLAWIIPNSDAALFIHSAVGYGISLAFPLSAVFFAIGFAINERLKFSDIYKIAVAGGFGHLLIDGIGHPGEPFVLLPRDQTVPFLLSPVGLVILGGFVVLAIVAITTSFFVVPMLKQRLPAWLSMISREAITVALVGGGMGVLVLMSGLMPFGSWSSVYFPDIWSTGIWGPAGYGAGFSSGWNIILSIGFSIFLAIIYRFLPTSTRVLLLLVYAAYLYLALWMNPNLGAMDADLGAQVWILVWFGYPLGLLVTSGKGISGQWRKFEYSEHQLAIPRFATKQFIAFALAGSIFGVVAGYVLVKYPYEYLGVAILVLVVVIVALLFHAMLITRRSRIGFAEQQMNPNPRDKDKSAVAVSIAENE